MSTLKNSAIYARDASNGRFLTSTSVIAAAAPNAVAFSKRTLIMCVFCVIAGAATGKYRSKSGMIIWHNALDTTSWHVEFAFTMSVVKTRSARTPHSAGCTKVSLRTTPQDDDIAF